MLKVGELLFPKKDTEVQLTLPLWPSCVAIIVAMDYCLDCDFDEQTPLEQRQRYVIYSNGELMYLTPYLLQLTYECR